MHLEWKIDVHIALLKAIAEKLIPGIPEGTRIALLQQSRLVDGDDNAASAAKGNGKLSVLQEVVDRATARCIVEQEIKCTFYPQSLA